MFEKSLRSDDGPAEASPLSRVLAYSNVIMSFLAALTGVLATYKVAEDASRAKLLFADFTVFWTAARFNDIYNAEAITHAQRWILPVETALRPFPYPPTGLLLIKPLGWFSYTTALVVWTALGIIAFALALRLYGKRGWLALLAPMVGMTVVVGQASLLLGAALAGGVALSKDRPVIAGALLGLLGAVKPQIAVLVPLALVCGRHWRALGTTVIVGASTIVASLLLGSHLWLDWLNSLNGFLQQVQDENFRHMNMAPGILFAPLGILAVWYVWTRTDKAELRLLALVAGTCLSLPYLMEYDLAAMAPAAAVLLLDRDWRAIIIGFFAFVVLWISPFIVAAGVAILVRRDMQCPAD